MTLLDAQPAKPKRRIFKYIPIWLFILIIAVAAGVITYELWDYPEERAVSRFTTTLEEGHYHRAYELWKPAASYSFSDFMHDWGPEGDYGKIRTFQIVQVKSEGSSTVEVMVRVNQEEPPLGILVDRNSKGLAYALSE
jgi:hypothetical protein